MLRLIDREKTYPVETAGTIFHISAMNYGDVMKASVAMKRISEGRTVITDEDISGIHRLLADNIIKIDDDGGLSVSDICTRLRFDDAMKLIDELMRVSGITTAERKN